MTKKEFENLEVGKTFELGYRKFKVVENKNICDGCSFGIFNCGILESEKFIPMCSKLIRKDKKHVIFVEVEDE